ncbi:MAG: hypothetical protein IPJ65_16690 [Archangiaceae bacterium]|nr:hypothetical protein [Archangiaceae bacterium]
MTDLRPLELGEIVDRSATFWRAHWRRLYGLFFVFSLAQYVLIKGGQSLVARVSPASRDLATMLRAALQDPQALQQQAPAVLLGLGLVLIVVLFGTQVTTTAAAHWVMPTLLGEKASVLDGVRYAVRRLGTLSGLFLLAIGWALLALVLFVMPAIALTIVSGLLASQVLAIIAVLLMGLGLLAWSLWFFLRFALWGPVVAAEPLSPLGAFKRCDALTSGRVAPGLMGLVKMRLMVLISVVAVVLLLISVISGAPIFVLRGIYGNLLDPAAGDVPAYLMVPAELLNLAAGAVMYPLYVAFQTLFYVDMRARREGLDLELQLKGLP